MSTAPTSTVLLIALTFAAVALAQPPRDTPATAVAAGTAVISGIVVSDETPPRPLRRARVSLIESGLRLARTAIAHDNGSFRFDRLPAGSYTVRVLKEPYVALAAGAARPARAGTVVSVKDGETRQLTLRMARGGVITGVVTGSDGQPLSGVAVSAMVYRYQSFMAERRLLPASIGPTGPMTGASGLTDDRGMYRLFGLAPDDYYIVAAVRPLTAIGDIHTPQGGRPVTYSQVYFPGTTVASQATAITLATAEERGGADIALQYVPTARIEGTVVSSQSGVQPPFSVMLLANQTGADIGTRQSTMTNAEGAFAFRSVAPGPYVVVARASVRPAASSVPAPPLMAIADVNIDGEDVGNLTLTLQPGLVLSGKLTFEGAQPPAVDFTKLKVTLPLMLSTAGGMPATTTPLQFDASGGFTIQGVVPGVVRIGGNAPVQGVRTPLGPWWLKSIAIDGREMLDRPIELRQSSTNVTVTFSDRASMLSGRVLDVQSQPLPAATVVAFSTDQASWFSNSRRIAGVRAGVDGTYSIRNLPAGEYFVAVSYDVEQNEWFDPVLLRRLAAGAQRISLTENEQKLVDLILR